MAKKVTVYGSRSLQAQDLLTFVELKPFTRLWRQLGLDDDDLSALQTLIMLNPKGPPVIPDTGPLRKMRFTRVDSNVGKSGAYRVCYAYLEEHGQVILALVYPKNQKDDLSNDDKKKIKRILDQIQEELDG